MLEVVCALIENDNKILICQRSEVMSLPLKWEFPGGKIKDGEAKVAALKREIKEELNLNIEVHVPLEKVTHHYPDFSICLYPFLCTSKTRDTVLTEHKQVAWESIDKLNEYDWAEADVEVMEKVMKNEALKVSKFKNQIKQ